VEVTVSSRHLEISGQLRDAATSKVGRLERYLSGVQRGEVHFSEERNPRISDPEVCEVTLEGKGHHVRCKAAGPDPFIALDRAVEKLERQLDKEKTKRLKRQKGTRR